MSEIKKKNKQKKAEHTLTHIKPSQSRRLYKNHLLICKDWFQYNCKFGLIWVH